MLGSTVRKRGLAAVGICAMLVATAACSNSEAGDPPPAGTPTSATPGASTTPGTSPSPSTSPTQDPSAANVTVTPAKGASGVRPDQPVKVVTSSGSLQQVTVTDSSGNKVSGSFDEAKSSWTSEPKLKPAARYTVSGTAQGSDGKTVEISSTFRTLSAGRNLKASVSPLDGETVGVAMPIQIFWNNAVTDRAAVEKRLSVKTSVPVEGSWHWMNSKQVNYRPKNYWPAGTKVTVDIATQGVNAGAGVWGSAGRQIDFTIGKSVISRVDVKLHRMSVTIDGKLARTFPITAGKAGFTTRSGVKVIMEKYRTKRMDARTVGIQPGDPEYYNIHNVQYAQRVTSSGEFIHGAPWSSGSQGTENVSHGCIGMSLKDGAWYFAQTLRGDPVVVTGTSRGMETGNGWTDWNESWAKYKAGSALS
ncbi:ErfK/YbiS/YcfS/YnhG family protein [Kribbella flavida DSM 17836]|uniref:ErfK/YbiS/YcfS/YnhG family protein n=1 Tax=Kribbella flavida (strain DSM 17836 / JCM 10339 / NBRC 14399) TaxID=479435 RepID=D2PZ54_KRIFD|nr:Ig-like domain-containing protein [Kribbella flavida]ADB31848.1 ErfK/YbiS/YcfS/YnhG family protein [Kribbella flavida DSM 17836]